MSAVVDLWHLSRSLTGTAQHVVMESRYANDLPLRDSLESDWRFHRVFGPMRNLDTVLMVT